ncbi:MAG: cytidylate kinase-like family protein [Coprobacillus sp.]|nr:cytidylate kinase-like family protein [Coprobacillus sp.]MDY4145272.1 cytidylate kinase-like family protein [Bacilli bacterium]CCY07495.1 cytidylate kinase [Coprobacillus sp. CAG:698]
MNKIITIGREFGSGGREFGRRLAEELNYEYYDKEIITEISKHTSLSEEYVKEVLEKKPHNLYPITIGQSMAIFNDYQTKQIQSIYTAQCEILKYLAEKSNCVIVGRCADYILKEYNPYRIFVHASMESRINRCLSRKNENEDLDSKKLEKYIKKVDKDRAKYYEFYTYQKWGDKKNYDLCVNTTNVNIKEIVSVIAKIFK